MTSQDEIVRLIEGDKRISEEEVSGLAQKVEKWDYIGKRFKSDHVFASEIVFQGYVDGLTIEVFSDRLLSWPHYKMRVLYQGHEIGKTAGKTRKKAKALFDTLWDNREKAAWKKYDEEIYSEALKEATLGFEGTKYARTLLE